MTEDHDALGGITRGAQELKKSLPTRVGSLAVIGKRTT
jgi:hypothetical protein